MNSQKLRRKLMLRRMSISAPTLSIGTKTPWWVRLAFIFVGLAFAAAAGVWLYEQGSTFAGFNKDTVQKELTRLKAENAALLEDRERLTKSSITSESGLIIEKATAKQIASQSKVLEAENAKLKEDLRFFESLLPATGGADAISVRNLRGQLDLANNQLIVRLLVMQGGKQVNNFVGNVQVTAAGIVDGKPATWAYPAAGAAQSAESKLNFSRYQRVELAIPLSATAAKTAALKNLQVRVLQGGSVKAQATGTVSQNVQNFDKPGAE
jgi:hypothetical protein